MSDFLPTDYEVPASSNGRYTKFQIGETRIRILSRAIIGYEYFNNLKKPVRSRKPFDSLPTDIGINDKGETNPIRHFWAFVVWNYDTKQIELCEITQKGLMQKIKSLVSDEDWGSPIEYDIKIVKEGEKLETRYDIKPIPAKPLSEEVANAFSEAMPVDLEQLFVNGDPFNPPAK